MACVVWALAFFPCSSMCLAAEDSWKQHVAPNMNVRRNSAHVINHQPCDVLDLKQVASYSWKFGRSAGPLCEAVSSPGKPFLFVWSFGGGGSFLQEGCEFAEELLHKENVPHCLQGDCVCQMDPFFLCLILKRRLCSSSPVWTGIVLFEGIVLSNTKLRDTAECQVFLINVLSGYMDFRHGEPYCVPTRSLCALDHTQKHCPGWVYLTNGTSERWCVSWADSRKSRTEGVVMMKS